MTGWANLGKEGESMPAQTPQDAAVPPTASETVDAADRLTAALAAMTGQLEAVNKRLDLAEKAARRSRRIIVGLVISLVLDVTLTILVTVFALQAHDASAQASATVEQLHASEVATCESSNQTRSQEITLWGHLAAVSKPAPGETPKEIAANKQAVDQFLMYVAKVFRPRDCNAIPGGTS